MKLNAKFAQALFALLIVATTATSASAGWNEFMAGVCLGFHRNNAWPDPFNEVDAAEVARPFEIMKANGWRMHNTIGHELFRSGDGALLASGHKRVHWIATKAPTKRRMVYVLSGNTRAETEARVAAVRETLTTLYVEGPVPKVFVTNIEPSTSSGAWATKINRDWLEHLAAPRLPSQSATGAQGVTAPTN